MITEDYVSFEVAKLLKEKGFNEHCFCINYPLPEGEHHSIILSNLLNNSMIPFTDEYKFCKYKEDFITIPTLQMAMKWLRKVHHIHIRLINSTDESYRYEIYPIEGKYKGSYFTDNCYYDTYEQAAEVAIKYCLENLI